MMFWMFVLAAIAFGYGLVRYGTPVIATLFSAGITGALAVVFVIFGYINWYSLVGDGFFSVLFTYILVIGIILGIVRIAR